MDEGFTSYIENKATNEAMEKVENLFKGTYAAYYKLVESGKEQAQNDTW
jgi:hypothetical protein